MKKKPVKAAAQPSEETRLREIADAVNPLAQLIRKNQRRADKRALNGNGLRDVRLPLAGAVLERKYKGRLISVRVLEVGFEYESKYYKTLSSVAFAVTGHHLSGYHFFEL